MSYTDLRDFEREYVTEIDGYTIEIEKLGGGTVGRECTGTWRYRVIDAGGDIVAKGQDCTTGTPHTHAYVANEIIAKYFLGDENH